MLGKRTQSKVILKTFPRLLLLPDYSCSTIFEGTPQNPGILPRVLDATFHYSEGRRYDGMDLKPYLRNDAQCLDPEQVKQERSAKAAIFASIKEVSEGFFVFAKEEF